MSQQAARILDQSVQVTITDVALAETAFVLTRVYGVPREDVVDALIDLVQKRTVRTLGLDKLQVVAALRLCRPSNRVSFADALIWAAARSHGIRTVYSFDRRFPATDIELLQPD